METYVRKGDIDCSPAEAGYEEEALSRLDRLLLDLIGQKQLQGASYLLSRDGKTFAHRSMGALRHTPDSAPLKPDSIRRIASVTKLFTVVSILRLIEEGQIHMHQAVKDWIPEYDHPLYEKITLYHLLTHTSGLRPDPGYYTEPYPDGWWDYEFAFGDNPDEEENNKDRTPEEIGERRRSQWIKAMLAGVPVCKPGEAWNYATSGYSLIGEIIRRQTGIPYDEYVKMTILEPLGMQHSFFNVPAELQDEVCVVNDWDGKRLEDKQDLTYMPPRAGGGLYTTLPDLDRFGRMLLNLGALDGQRIISRKSVEEMTRDHFPDGIPAYHWGEKLATHHTGLGTYLGGALDLYGSAAFGHEGAGRSMLLVDPSERLVATFFVPSAVDWVPLSLFGVKNIIWSGLQ